MAVLYNMIYRLTSGGASHVSTNALDRHVMARPNHPLSYPNIIQSGQLVSQPLILSFQPETRDLLTFLSGATSAILHAMKALGDIFPQEAIDRTVKRYTDLWSTLVL